MRPTLTVCLVSIGVLSAAPRAHAEDPIVAVVEVNGGKADVAAIRERLARQLDVPVVSVFDRGSVTARGTLTIVVDYQRGEARAQYRTKDETLIWTTAAIPADADAQGLWVVDHAVAVVHASALYRSPVRLATCLEVLDPWRDDQPVQMGRQSYRLPSEVLDPFAELDADSRRGTGYQLPPEVLDPWASERSESTATAR